MKTSDFPSVREARLTVKKHMERYKKLMGIKKGKAMIELPIHPDCHVMKWTDAELRAISTYGDQRAAEAREQMREAAKALCRELEANPENSHDYQCAAGWCAEKIAGLK